jgi:hypothetical protein
VPLSKSIRVFCASLLALSYLSLLAASAPHRVHHLGQALAGMKTDRAGGRSARPTSHVTHVAFSPAQTGNSQGPGTDDSPHWPQPTSAESCTLSVASAQNPGHFCAAVVLAQMQPVLSLLASPSPDLPPFDRIDPRATRGPPFRDWLV